MRDISLLRARHAAQRARMAVAALKHGLNAHLAHAGCNNDIASAASAIIVARRIARMRWRNQRLGGGCAMRMAAASRVQSGVAERGGV